MMTCDELAAELLLLGYSRVSLRASDAGPKWYASAWATHHATLMPDADGVGYTPGEAIDDLLRRVREHAANSG